MASLDPIFLAAPGATDAITGLLEAITDAVVLVDPSWRFIYVNAHSEQLLRQSRTALVGTAMADAFPEIVGSDFETHFRDAIARQTSVSFEAHYPPLASWFAVRAFPAAPGLLISFQDITARRVAEAGLRLQTQLLDQVPASVIATDLAGIVTHWNAHATVLYGWTRDEALGRHVGTMTVSPSDPAVTATIWQRLRTGGRWEGEFQARNKAGAIFPAYVTNAPLHDPSGELVGIVGVSVDVSARHATEAALRASEARLAEAQRIANLGSWEFDHPTRMYYWSDELFRIAGHAPQAFVPTPEATLALIHPHDRERVEQIFATTTANGSLIEEEFRLVRPDGTIRTVRQRIEVVLDPAGQATKHRGVVHDVTERLALEARLEYQATHDQLTGLPNRALFLDRLGQALARWHRDGRRCAVIFLDLDHFKDVNDSLGHDVGDRLLLAVTARLQGVLRNSDTLARLGGDEFTVLLEGVSEASEAVSVGQHLAAVLADPFPLGGRDHRVTVSIGIVLSTAHHSRPEDLLRDADVALYRAKSDGRADYALFDPAMQAELTERLELERDLRRALERGEFRVYYEPNVDLATGRVIGLEALVRWHHPERGLVLPGAFIPLAEATGLIVPLGRWVLRAACAQLRAWQARYPHVAAPFIAVNLSIRQFRHSGLLDDIATTLRATGLAPDRLMLEVTETVAMAHTTAAGETLAAMKALGVRLAIDDFGTGHSSLAYLQRLPMDTLKIDRTFLAEGERNRAIVRAIAELAHGLGLSVTAEGLETAAQVAWARAARCDQGQGYHFGRPLPSDQIEALWADDLMIELPGLAQPSAQFANTGPRLGAMEAIR